MACYGFDKIAWKFRWLVIKRRKNIGFDKIAWKFRLHIIKPRKNYGFDKIAWKFRWLVIKQKPVKREAWISGTEPVAKRQATTHSYLARGPGHSRPYYQGTREARGRGGNRFPRPWKRGFRGGRGGRRGRGWNAPARPPAPTWSSRCKLFILRFIVLKKKVKPLCFFFCDAPST